MKFQHSGLIPYGCDDDIWVEYLFGLNLGGHYSRCPSVRPFGLRKPQKVPKEVSTYFSLNLTWSETLMLPKIPPGHSPEIVMLCFCLTRKVFGHLFTSLGTFSGFQSPNSLTEGHVLRCPSRFSPKRDFHLLSIIRSPEVFFCACS